MRNIIAIFLTCLMLGCVQKGELPSAETGNKTGGDTIVDGGIYISIDSTDTRPMDTGHLRIFYPYSPYEDMDSMKRLPENRLPDLDSMIENCIVYDETYALFSRWDYQMGDWETVDSVYIRRELNIEATNKNIREILRRLKQERGQ